jgi:hypothetical protein
MAKIRLKQDRLQSLQGDQEVPDHVAAALAQAGYADRLDEQGNVIDTQKMPEGRKRMRLKRTLQEGAVIEVSDEVAGVLESSGLAAYPGANDTNAAQAEPAARFGLGAEQPGDQTRSTQQGTNQTQQRGTVAAREVGASQPGASRTGTSAQSGRRNA